MKKQTIILAALLGISVIFLLALGTQGQLELVVRRLLHADQEPTAVAVAACPFVDERGDLLPSAKVEVSDASIAQTAEQPIISFEQLFPKYVQRQMGLHKLTATEREKLRAHVEQLLIRAIASSKTYAGVGGGHWIKKNVNSGTYIILEDGSLWKIDPIDKVGAMLWLPSSEITVVESSSGSPGYDYLLINTDDGEKAHAKYLGHE